MKLGWAIWIYGLLAAVIGGGAASVTSAFVASGLAPGQFSLSGGDAGWNTLKLMGLTFVVNGIVSAAAFLKQSPLPAIIAAQQVAEQQKATMMQGEKKDG